MLLHIEAIKLSLHLKLSFQIPKVHGCVVFSNLSQSLLRTKPPMSEAREIKHFHTHMRNVDRTILFAKINSQELLLWFSILKLSPLE